MDTKKFLCEIHNYMEYLYFGETSQIKSRLPCARCIIGTVNTEEINLSLLLKDVNKA